jgi:hypothetical protein
LKKLKQRRSPLGLSVERSVRANAAATLAIYFCFIAVGGLWGIGAVFCYFQIEILLKGQGEGVVAAGFFPLFMLPWAAVAARTSLRLLGEWSEILSPARIISN